MDCTKLMRYLYTLLFYTALPFLLLRMLWRSWKIKGYRYRLLERFGYIAALNSNEKSLWLHAVSVGEVIAAIPLIKALLEGYPQYTLVVTTTTPTGFEQVYKTFGDRIHHVYFLYDLPGPVNRFLNRIHPQLAIIMETELWPNLLYYSHRKRISILLANARLSERSMHNYRRIAQVTRKMLSQITCVAAQSDLDGKRFLQLGLASNRLLITGNIKFDLHLPESLIDEGKSLRRNWGLRPTLIAASTHEGEEIIILEAFRQLRHQFQDALLILVPRHPDRFDKVARLCKSTGFSIAKRSLHRIPHSHADILLGDTMGELRLLYAASDVAFVGGSLIPIGGHNLIEPAAVRLPIISGPNLQNFVAISDLLKTANALIIVSDSKNLFTSVARLFHNPQERKNLGERAYQVSTATANIGALDRHIQWIDAELTRGRLKGNNNRPSEL
ncbi:lipid IV(A) 3-deoxy-D-manno-octulosonic acid transferase [Coxiella-like endosymbiont]|uniref:lipid IV(A) 3-deoxy-D-manno-octulosonic acid transferase n=1 Tax=Coxiella-like endosymbiont TaxID=1592897 RepID=UPI00272B11BE|nr:lipid IV(A) 3-deoxy-D-manno-octulosonic acid transferase [Coxiella-like endosymbiont]